ncbi:hypothetical protein SSX86_003024 [Deinandra increscens subsp. villosa]|uniref:Uncharacterized protein n=1 Tax=Deinandra increscens subsp. villosa TaxID=3103831 RepID=A0AAP0DHL8_9ASTR
MERTEPTFVPEWLKSSGGLSTTSHQLTSSSSRSDDHGLSKTGRNRDRDKDIFEFRNKEKSVNRHHDYSDPLGNILPRRFEKNGFRQSHSNISGKRGESWPKKCLPIGNSAVLGGDGWTSALAEVPVIVGSSGNGSSVAHPVQSASVSYFKWKPSDE